ncbi:17087_t:CDS:2, partial [Racocetra persica]
DIEKLQPTRFLYDDSDSEFEEDFDYQNIDSLGPPVLRLSHFKNNTKFLTNTLLIGINGGGNSFIESISSNKKLIGTILLPEIELIHNTLNQENISNQGCFIYEMDSSPKTLLIPCNYNVNDERCFVWAKTLFNHIEAER